MIKLLNGIECFFRGFCINWGEEDQSSPFMNTQLSWQSSCHNNASQVRVLYCRPIYLCGGIWYYAVDANTVEYKFNAISVCITTEIQ